MAGPVPFNDLRRRSATNADQLGAVASRVIASGSYLFGSETVGFEGELARFCDRRGAVTVANGTDALEIALRAVGCGPGDEVALAANAGGYATAACLAIGAVPVFADIDPLTLLPTAEQLAGAGAAARAVVATHLYGNVVDVDSLRATLPRGVTIIEDCAQAHGASLRGRPVGSLGDAATFSFYPTKNLGGLGDGGAVVSDDPDVLEQARRLRQYGWTERYSMSVPGGRNSRMDEIQAGFLRVLLPELPEGNRRRRAILDRYHSEAPASLRFPQETPGSVPSAHLAVARSSERRRVLGELENLGVTCAVHYPIPDHHQPVVRAATHRHQGLTHTEQACDEVFSLPCFPELEDHEVDRVLEALHGVLA